MKSPFLSWPGNATLYAMLFAFMPIWSQALAAQPNIILILADDLGYGDLSCYGNKVIQTPNIDKLAASGARFTDFYAAGAWCLPSRKGLMTGTHPYRGGLKLDQAFSKRITLAEMLKTNAYRTKLIGKWHLGMSKGLHPLDQGFDSFYGTADSNDPKTSTGKSQVYETFRSAKESDWPVPLYRERDVIEKPARQSLFTQRYTHEALSFIEENKSAPFFLYVAHNMPHVPLFASENFKGKSGGGIFGDVVEELDWSVGQIIKKLESLELSDNTLVIFSSDNGPWTMLMEFGGSAKPLRGEKGTGWEGGAGVPAIISWPKHIEPMVSSEFMVNLDLFQTIASITKSKLPSGYQIDSLDMSGVLFNQEKSPRKNYVFFSGPRWRTDPFSYRSGHYKIHLQSNDQSRNPHNRSRSPVTTYDPPALFDLLSDRSETKDLSATLPKVVTRLHEEFRQETEALKKRF